MQCLRCLFAVRPPVVSEYDLGLEGECNLITAAPPILGDQEWVAAAAHESAPSRFRYREPVRIGNGPAVVVDTGYTDDGVGAELNLTWPLKSCRLVIAGRCDLSP